MRLIWNSFGRLVLLACCIVGMSAQAQEANLNEAIWAEQQGNYLSARRLYQHHLDASKGASVDHGSLTRASIGLRMSVLDEAIRFGEDPAVSLFLGALTHRDNREYVLAIDQLRLITEQFPTSYLADDAHYLIGYIALMDQFDFRQAHEALRTLLFSYPQTRYYDTAMYSEAIALEQLGDTKAAIERFEQLRQRHSQVSLQLLKIRVPSNNVISRYWFDRADKRLGILQARVNGAAKVVTRRLLSSHVRTLKVTVDVDGRELVLLLEPSRLDKNTLFKDADGRAISAPRANYYTGKIEGVEDSWVRVSMEGNSIEGIAQRYGERIVLHPDTHIGTIDYYQPKQPLGNELRPDLQDYVMEPPAQTESSALQRVNLNKAQADSNSVSRVAQIAVVIDSQYNDYYGGNGLAYALSALNVADGIFREDFQLALEVVSATVFDSRERDPMNLGPVTLETMLRKFRDYRMGLGNSSTRASLTYLFSGNRNSDQAIGLAWIGAACRLDGYDVGVTTPSDYGDLLVTHELGHSFGAQHDTDTNCKDNTHRLMWPRISSLTTQEFSQCSHNVLNKAWTLQTVIPTVLPKMSLCA